MSRLANALMVAALLAGLSLACASDKINPKGDRSPAAGDGGIDTGGTAVSYSKTIAPMLEASCAVPGCHGGGSPALGIGLDSYDGAKTYASLSNSAIQNGSMPIGSGAALSAADKKNFQDWVSAGAPNN
jgi:hypothetical protein